MIESYYDLEGQPQRLAHVNRLLVQFTWDHFDEAGSWVGATPSPALRERFWYAMAYAGSGNPKAVELASHIITKSTHAMCHFAPMGALQLLLKYRGQLTEAAVLCLETYILHVLDHFNGGDLDFIGVNDNYPAMGAFTALLGGMLFHREDLYETGRNRLHQLKALLTRRGFTTEYTSPTYTPIQAYAMAEIANHIADEPIKQLALQCEERIWADLASHYHPATSHLAGPYSRAYTVDSAGHTYSARYVLYAVLGDKLPVHPLNTLFASENGLDGEIIHGDVPFMQVSAAWMLNTVFHCPVYLAEHALSKTYPYTVQGTMEFSSSTDNQPDEASRNPYQEEDTYEYAAGSGTVSTYMTEDYALGAASSEYHNGTQNDAFHLLYRRRVPAVRQPDIGTVYAKYIINDKKPGQSNDYESFGMTVGSNSLWDEGRKLGLQHKNAAMFLYKPKIYGNLGVTSLKLSLIFPAQYGPIEEIWLGDKKLDHLSGGSLEPCPVYVKDGPVYIVFHPLILTDYGRELAVKVEQVNGFVSISFYNYEGEKRDFARRGFLLTGNGFVTEVRSESEAGSFTSFRESMKAVQLSDTLFTSVHSRQTYLRRTKYEREGLALDSEISMVSEGVKYAAINGKIPVNPVLAMTNLDVSKLPFMT